MRDIGYFYTLYGLTLESEIPLHAPPAPAGKADLRVHAGVPRAVPAEPAIGELLCQLEYGTGGAAHVRTASGYSLRYYNTAEFEFNAELTHVTAHADPNAKADLVPELLTASIPAFKLLLSGRVVLHASAVARGGKAIGIMAQSGGGKSTIAAAMCQQGFAPVTDDVLVLDWAGDTAHVLPGPAEIRLRAGSAALSEERHSRESGNPVRKTADGRAAVSFGAAVASATQLGVLVIPVIERAAAGASLARLDANEALAAILGHLRVAGWKDTPALKTIFAEQVRLARLVPTYRLTLSWGPEGLREAAAKVANL